MAVHSGFLFRNENIEIIQKMSYNYLKRRTYAKSLYR